MFKINLFKRISNSWIWTKYKYHRTHECEHINNYFRRQGIKIGENCKIYSKICSPEPYLIEIGDNVTISSRVQFITHDNSICKIFSKYTDVFGRIKIGDNCFIGANTIILPGVSVGKGTIIGAGSVVTKSFDGNVVIGGNPAKVLSSLSDYATKISPYCISTNGLDSTKKKELLLNSSNLIKK